MRLQHSGYSRFCRPIAPESESRLWYQYYFHSERGRAGLEQHRFDLCKLLWRLWSPSWCFDDATYQLSAGSFDNPDFVPVVIHSYRHRFGLVAGDPDVEDIEHQLIAQPQISVPTVVLHGGDDGVMPEGASVGHKRFFSAAYQRQVIPGAGHDLPQEKPEAFSAAVLSLV
jgi:pimeloyl-ACP methyl ester carboxylesterase